ncbi:hypothetical protein C8J57DRAFT_1720816 [Mycena rebaudengoi]|nr:hypothetical protein C8J57DRAFT_1720816 [Mycena rebaudengoi]
MILASHVPSSAPLNSTVTTGLFPPLLISLPSPARSLALSPSPACPASKSPAPPASTHSPPDARRTACPRRPACAADALDRRRWFRPAHSHLTSTPERSDGCNLPPNEPQLCQSPTPVPSRSPPFSLAASPQLPASSFWLGIPPCNVPARFPLLLHHCTPPSFPHPSSPEGSAPGDVDITARNGCKIFAITTLVLFSRAISGFQCVGVLLLLHPSPSHLAPPLLMCSFAPTNKVFHGSNDTSSSVNYGNSPRKSQASAWRTSTYLRANFFDIRSFTQGAKYPVRPLYLGFFLHVFTDLLSSDYCSAPHTHPSLTRLLDLRGRPATSRPTSQRRCAGLQ